MKTLKLLLTNKIYRWAILQDLKLKFLSLPIIRHIRVIYHTFKIKRKMKGMEQWDQYVTMRGIENNAEKFNFAYKLFNLKLYMMADGEFTEEFESAKEEVLKCAIINKPELRKFKEWLESIDSSEKDYSEVEKVFKSFTQKTN